MDAPTTRERPLNWRRRVLVLLVFVVAGAVLVESWHAAKNAAETGGRPWPWLWPVTLEAFIFVLVLVYWDARSTQRKAPMARVMLALTTVVASAVQILDAPQTWLGWLTAGWTPVSLLAAVEFSVWLLHGSGWRPDRPIPDRPPAEHPESEPDEDDPAEPEPDDQPTRPNNRTRWSPADDPRVLAGLAAGQSPFAIKNDLGLSDRRYRALLRYRDEQQATLVPSRNGQGGGS
jgi:hypothetical protein